MTVSNTRQNLRLDIQGSENALKAGDTLKRILTLKNQGQQDAKIDVWIHPLDQQSDLLHWVSWNLRKHSTFPIPLKSGTSDEIEVQFKVPAMARPGVYAYEIQAESSAYPGEIAKRSQQFEVRPSEHYLEDRNEPTFSIQPHTSSEQPQVIQPGQSLDVEILVKNRSKQIGQFSVSCPELINWIQGKIPELSLFPEESGTIKLHLQPPDNAIAGNYSSTLRLKSHNSNLTLLDILYFKLEVDDRLSFAIIDETPPILTAESRFTLHITNLGNVQRPLKVIPKDGARLFHYDWKAAQLSDASGDVQLAFRSQQFLKPWRSIAADQLQLVLAPKESIRLQLSPQITLKPWRRLWLGRDREVPFKVELRNADLEPTEALFLPEPSTGTLRWKPYPRWFIGLLLLIPVFLLVNAGYQALWQWGVKPSLMPKISEFSATEKSYQVDSNTPVKLNWEISNIGLLKETKLIQTDSPGKEESPTFISFDLEKPNLKELNHDPVFEQWSEKWPERWFEEWSKKQTKPDENYEKLKQKLKEKFKEKPKEKPNTGSQSNQPQAPTCNVIIAPIKTNWSAFLWEMLYQNKPEMKIYAVSKGYVLHCNGVETNPKQAGKYSFKLEITQQNLNSSFSSKSQILPLKDDANPSCGEPPKKPCNIFSKLIDDSIKSINNSVQFASNSIQSTKDTISNWFDSPPSDHIPTDSKTIQDVTITSAPPATIQAFSAKITAYREVSSATSQSTSDAAKLPAPPIRLSWTISNPNQLEKLNLSWSQVGFDGKVAQPQTKIYTLQELKGFCTSKENYLLVCEDVPVAINSAGQYTFTLTPTSKSQTPPTAKTIQNIQIRPPLPQINAFAVNGKNAIETPKQVLIINPVIGAIDVALSWDILNQDRMKVELLPAPGVIDPTRPPMLTYSLSSKSSSTMVLRVTNQAGETIERSVVIETTEYIPPERAALSNFPPLPPPPPPPDGAAPSGSPTKPPERSGDLPAYELPPRTN